jgi:hypothetical protein
MAIDLKKMRSKLDRLEGKGRASSAFWKPQDGDQTIRILPCADGDPFKEFWFHYNLGDNRGFLSPKRNFGEDDPLDSFVRQLFNSGSEEDIKMAKNLMARQRFFSPVIVRGEEEKGVRLWGYGKMAYKELVTLALNPDYDDITDPETGTDLVINYGKPPGAAFPKTTITPRRRSSTLFANDPDGSQAAEAMRSIPDYDKVFSESRKTPNEVGIMLDEWLSGEATAESGRTVEKYGSTNSTESQVDQKFAELLNSSAAV